MCLHGYRLRPTPGTWVWRILYIFVGWPQVHQDEQRLTYVNIDGE